VTHHVSRGLAFPVIASQVRALLPGRIREFVFAENWELEGGNWKLTGADKGWGASEKRPQPFSYLAAGIVIFVALMASPFSVPVSSTWWPAWAAMVFELWLTSA